MNCPQLRAKNIAEVALHVLHVICQRKFRTRKSPLIRRKPAKKQGGIFRMETAVQHVLQGHVALLELVGDLGVVRGFLKQPLHDRVVSLDGIPIVCVLRNDVHLQPKIRKNQLRMFSRQTPLRIRADTNCGKTVRSRPDVEERVGERLRLAIGHDASRGETSETADDVEDYDAQDGDVQ